MHPSRPFMLIPVLSILFSLTACSHEPAPLAFPFNAAVAHESQQRWTRFLGTTPQVTNTRHMHFTLIPPGTFTMGTLRDRDKRKYWAPAHQVTLTKPFFLGTYEVTVAQFRAFVEATAYKTDAENNGGSSILNPDGWAVDPDASWRNVGYPQADNHPVVCVSWNDATAFCQWLSATEKKTYRLPTEAEWEFACRAGSQTACTWGDNPDDGQHFANTFDLTLEESLHWNSPFHFHDGFIYTSPVGSFAPNNFGLFDMTGNAWEWCSDWYADYPDHPITDPRGPALPQANRVARGGSWASGPDVSFPEVRHTVAQAHSRDGIGFRCLLEIP